jgi:hypothetical protein
VGGDPYLGDICRCAVQQRGQLLRAILVDCVEDDAVASGVKVDADRSAVGWVIYMYMKVGPRICIGLSGGTQVSSACLSWRGCLSSSSSRFLFFFAFSPNYRRIFCPRETQGHLRNAIVKHL